MLARRTASLLVGAVLATALLAAVAQAGRAPMAAVGVSAREYRLAAYRTSVPRGLVRFNLVNFGEDGHDLVVRTPGGREVGRTGEVRSGKRTTLQLRLAPGRYRLICDLADHEARGMVASLRVTR
jgi:plastocyanin